MKTFEITGYATIKVRTILEADSEETAIEIAKSKSLEICHHGTSESDAEESWVLEVGYEQEIDVDCAQEC